MKEKVGAVLSFGVSVPPTRRSVLQDAKAGMKGAFEQPTSPLCAQPEQEAFRASREG